MIRFDSPYLPRPLCPLLGRHLQAARRPVLRVAVGGGDPKHQDEAIPFQMHLGAMRGNGNLRQRAIAAAIGIDQAIAFQARQPVPVVAPDRFEVVQATVPAIEGHQLRLEPPGSSGGEHGAEVGILGQPVGRLVKEPVVAWDSVRASTPHERDQVNARDNTMMLARPMAMDQRDLVSIGFIEGGIIDNQQPAPQVHLGLSFFPQRDWVGVPPLEEPGESVAGRPAGAKRLRLGGFGTGDDARRGHQEVNVIQISHFRCIHNPTILYTAPTA